MNPQCTIIIPVYNEENNITTCLDSIKKQKYKHIEVILVDDGSTDNSALLVNKAIEVNKDLKIKYIYQENSGAASARLKGANLANSDYVVFLDCDDWLDEDSILLSMNEFKDEDIDLSLFHLLFVKSKNKNTPNIPSFQYYTNMKKIVGCDGFLHSISSWGLHGCGIIKRHIFLNAYIKYSEINNKFNYLNNDEIITRLCFLNSRYISLSNGKYFYYKNTNSTTQRINNNYHYIIYNAIILSKLVINENFNDKKFIQQSIDLLARTVWGVFLRYLKWRKCIDLKSWEKSINIGIDYYSHTDEMKNLKQLIKVKIIKLYLKLVI